MIPPASGFTENLSNLTQITIRAFTGQSITFTPISKAATILGLPAIEGYSVIGRLVGAAVVVGSLTTPPRRR